MLDDYAFRSLERLGKQQASLTREDRTRQVLEEMALEELLLTEQIANPNLLRAELPRF
jgi:hypothetical protein